MKSREHINAEADQRLVDALLRGQHKDTQETLDSRIDRVLEEMNPVVSQEPAKNGRIFKLTLGASAIAAVLMVSLIVLQPTPVSAISLLEKAQKIELTRNSGDQRYRVAITPRLGGPNAPELKAILDVRDGHQIRFDLTQPNGTHHVWGLGPSGPWEKAPHRRVAFLEETRWPKLLEGESLSLLIDTMPSLLDLVITGYNAEDLSDHRIRATKRDEAENGPDGILIDLNENTGEVAALELRWDSQKPGTSNRGSTRPGKGERLRREPPRGGRSDRFMPPPRPPGHKGEGPRDRSGRPPHMGGKGPGSPFGRPKAVSPLPGVIRFERISSVDVPVGWFSGNSSN